MNTSPEIGSIAAALAKAQGEFPKLIKDKTAKIASAKGTYTYDYADLATVIDTLRPAMTKNELAFVQSVKTEGTKAIVTTRLLHSSGQFIESDPVAITAQSERPQDLGSASTYARRYSLSGLLGIASDVDDDANGAQGNDAHTAPRTPAPPPSQPKKPPVDLEALKKSLGERMAKCRSMKEWDVIRADIPEGLKKDMAPTYTMMLERLAGEGDKDAEMSLSHRNAKPGKEAA